MVKNKYIRNSLVIGPPLALILIGIGVYIFVVKLLAPDIKTISATPNQTIEESSSSATSEASPSATPTNPITTDVTATSDADLNQWQSDADKGDDAWRLDPVSAAEQQAGSYGFIPGDQLTLVTEDKSQTPAGSATIIALHGNDTYLITMIQPKKQGSSGIWIIQAIEKQSW